MPHLHMQQGLPDIVRALPVGNDVKLTMTVIFGGTDHGQLGTFLFISVIPFTYVATNEWESGANDIHQGIYRMLISIAL